MRVWLPRSFKDQAHKIVGPQGFNFEQYNWWQPLRVALAVSLSDPTLPKEQKRGGAISGSEREDKWEMSLEQLTGQGQGREDDYDNAVRLLLMVRHGVRLFDENEDHYEKLLVAHIGRGLELLEEVIESGQDIYQYFASGLTPWTPGNAAERTDSLLARLLDLGIRAENIGASQGPRLDYYLIRLTRTDYLTRLKSKREELAFALGIKGLGIERGEGPMEVYITVPRPTHQWSVIGSSDFLGWMAATRTKGSLEIWPGVDTLGRPIVLDLADAPHLLVAGTTNSGKTMCVSAIILSLAKTHSPTDVQLILVDPKQTDFRDFESLPHLHSSGIVYSAEDAVQRLHVLEREVEERQRKLVEVGHRNLIEARKAGSLGVPFIVVVIDELTQLVQDRPEAEDALVRLAQKSRATGVHLVLATQRPDAKTFSGQLRANVPSRIALSVQKATDSRIILDEEGAEQLLGRGDMLIQFSGTDIRRAHGVYFSAEEVRSIVRTIAMEATS